MQCTVLISILLPVLAIVTGLEGAHNSSEDDIQLPISKPAKILLSDGSHCPTDEQRGKVREEINEEVHEILQEYVLPALGVLCDLGECPQNPVDSCHQLVEESPPSSLNSGHYWIVDSNGSAVQVYCNIGGPCCNTSGGWTRVAFLDMTDGNQQCPEGFRFVPTPKRSCGRPSHLDRHGCVSAVFKTFGIEFTKVCGRVIGYQDKITNAFQTYIRRPELTLDDAYVDGVSMTYGEAPRKHLWTFASARREGSSGTSACPCTSNATGDAMFTWKLPPYVGNNYFCDTGVESRPQQRFYGEDPLWDGQGCGSESNCCEFNNPPWFCRELEEPTIENIELRICSSHSIDDEDIPVEQFEVYIQ